MADSPMGLSFGSQDKARMKKAVLAVLNKELKFFERPEIKPGEKLTILVGDSLKIYL